MTVPDGWRPWRERLLSRLGEDPVRRRPDVRRKATLVLLDDLAAMVFARRHRDVARFAEAAARAGSGQEATIVVGGRATRERAAAANAVAAAWDELDEGYRPAACHGGLYTVPAAIAEAEATGRTLDDVLTAVVVGYEVAATVARAFPGPRPLVLHPHATLSPLGAAAAVTWLRTESPAAVLDAVDAAASMSMVGPFGHAVRGAQIRNAWAAGGALLGFLAADAVAAGLAGDPHALVEVFAGTYGQPLAPVESDVSPDHWSIVDGYHKLYGTCQYTHAAVECALTLAQSTGPEDLDGLDEVVVATHPLALALDDREPRTILGGKFSVPHAVAAVLVHRRADPAVFSAESLHDARIAAVRQRVRLVPYEPLPPAPHDRPARVTLKRRDGTTSEAECLSAVGGPDRPLTDDQVLAKAVELTAASAPGFATAAPRLLRGNLAGTTPWSEVLAVLLSQEAA